MERFVAMYLPRKAELVLRRSRDGMILYDAGENLLVMMGDVHDAVMQRLLDEGVPVVDVPVAPSDLAVVTAGRRPRDD
ncbi:MAG: hypothetical protein JNK05_37735 [Myxococcales bacterium]|nr:hypothetical protein [Myxococcales bacterium]